MAAQWVLVGNIKGPPGQDGTGSGAGRQLWEQNIPVADPPVFPYLRFETDADGDVEYIYYGSED